MSNLFQFRTSCWTYR